MSTIATGDFEIVRWQEDLIEAYDGGRRLARARVAARYSGGIEGDAEAEYLLAYRVDGSAEFAGLQWIAGRVGARSGTLVLQVTGCFDGEKTRADWRIVRGAGSAGLSATSGDGSFQAGRGRAGRYRLDCAGCG